MKSKNNKQLRRLFAPESFLQEVLRPKSLLIIFLTGFFYVISITYFLNYRFIIQTLSGNYPIIYKLKIFLILPEGIFTAFSPADTALAFITGLLLGINLLLVFLTSTTLRGKKIKFFIGGSGVIGFISTGCATCGLSFLSLIGIGTSFGLLSLNGRIFHFISISALLFSIFYLTKKINESKYCGR